MSKEVAVHPYCDICRNELTEAESQKNKEFENYEFPICDECFTEIIDKIKYVIKNS